MEIARVCRKNPDGRFRCFSTDLLIRVGAPAAAVRWAALGLRCPASSSLICLRAIVSLIISRESGSKVWSVLHRSVCYDRRVVLAECNTNRSIFSLSNVPYSPRSWNPTLQRCFRKFCIKFVVCTVPSIFFHTF
jgi:hypothetical protein